MAGTTDYVDYMGNNRTSYFWIAARGAFDSNVEIDVYLRTNDGANAVNVLLDVVRAVSYSFRNENNSVAQSRLTIMGSRSSQKPVLLRKADAEFNKKYVK